MCLVWIQILAIFGGKNEFRDFYRKEMQFYYTFLCVGKGLKLTIKCS